MVDLVVTMRLEGREGGREGLPMASSLLSQGGKEGGREGGKQGGRTSHSPSFNFYLLLYSESRDGLVELPEQFAYICRLLHLSSSSFASSLPSSSWSSSFFWFWLCRVWEAGREGGRGEQLLLSFGLGGFLLLFFRRSRQRHWQALQGKERGWRRNRRGGRRKERRKGR
jgi:hypothetical protein